MMTPMDIGANRTDSTPDSRNVLKSPILASSGVSPKKSTGQLHNRAAVTLAPAAPRVSCNSSFFSAVLHRKLIHWLSRKAVDHDFSPAERKARPTQAKQAISRTLKSDIGKTPSNWCNSFKKILADAVWYEVNINGEIDRALSTMTVRELQSVKDACKTDTSLNWLGRKIGKDLIAERKDTETKKFQEQLKIGFFSSAVLCSKGNSLRSAKQKDHWEKISTFIENAGVSDIEEKISVVVSNSRPWALLPFANHSRTSITSPVLEEFCRQALDWINSLKEINFEKLTDQELVDFSKLLAHNVLSKHVPACQDEIRKREKTAKHNQLASHLQNQLMLLTANSVAYAKSKKISATTKVFEGMQDHEISAVTLRIIEKADPQAVLRISKMKSDDIGIKHLIEAADATIEAGPAVKLLTQENLIAYLNLSEMDLSQDVRTKLITEANNRLEKSYKSCCKVLKDALNSDSAEGFVRAIKEFQMIETSSALLEQAAGLTGTRQQVLEDFLEAMEKIGSRALLRAQYLRDGMYLAKGHALALRLGEMIPKITGYIEHTADHSFTDRDRQIMDEVIPRYFPDLSTASPSNFIKSPVDSSVAPKILKLFESDLNKDNLFRKVRTRSGEEIPVCELLDEDQNRTMVEINGVPVFYSDISNPEDRMRAFSSQMLAIPRVNEKQVMMASRIVTQTIANGLPELIDANGWFSLNGAELEKLGMDGSSTSALCPANLACKQNFTMNRNGNLTANVRIFNDQVERWFSNIKTPAGVEGRPVVTDPEKSHFSLELTFEIGPDGNIRKCNLDNLAVAREVMAFW